MLTWVSHRDLKITVIIDESYYHPSCNPSQKTVPFYNLLPLILVSYTIKYQMIPILSSTHFTNASFSPSSIFLLLSPLCSIKLSLSLA